MAEVRRNWALVLATLPLVGAAWQACAASPPITALETGARAGITAAYSNFEENIFPQDSEHGALVGVQAELGTLMRSGPGIIGLPDLYGGIEYDFAAGFPSYHGNLRTPGYPPYRTQNTNYNNVVIVRLGLGRPAGASEIIPYIAAGYQNWNRNIGGPAGYHELYRSGLVGGGVRLDFSTGPTLVWRLSAESLALIGPSISAPSQDFSAALAGGTEERVALDADYRIANAWYAFVGLGITHYSQGGSRPDSTGVYEPSNSAFQLNSILGIAYGF